MQTNEVKTKRSWRSNLKGIIFRAAFNTGAVRLGRAFWADYLTVLNYHRIIDPAQPGFDSFKPNVSASPEQFAGQMDYLARWFNVVSLSDLVDWLGGKKTLPAHAALITFDDGYLDNYTFAYPILKKHNFSAVIFLASGHIQNDSPFFWDLIAYCFYHTQKNHLTLPDGAPVHWASAAEMEQVSRDLIERLKLMGNEEKEAWVARLPSALGVSIPANYFRNLMLTWEQVREMRANGIEFGGHTINHPILTRVSLEQAQKEIAGSKTQVERELNEPALVFAYPNGLGSDFNADIEKLTAQAGYKAAFTLFNGPSSYKEVKANPFAIRRIFISHKHTLPQFSVLVSGVNRYRA